MGGWIVAISKRERLRQPRHSRHHIHRRADVLDRRWIGFENADSGADCLAILPACLGICQEWMATLVDGSIVLPGPRSQQSLLG